MISLAQTSSGVNSYVDDKSSNAWAPLTRYKPGKTGAIRMIYTVPLVVLVRVLTYIVLYTVGSNEIDLNTSIGCLLLLINVMRRKRNKFPHHAA